MNTIWTALERDFNEQLAGITPPQRPEPLSDESLARLREATPVPVFHPHPPSEL